MDVLTPQQPSRFVEAEVMVVSSNATVDVTWLLTTWLADVAAYRLLGQCHYTLIRFSASALSPVRFMEEHCG